MSRYYSIQSSPIGELLLLSDGESLTGLYMEPHAQKHLQDAHCDDRALKPVREQLVAYFAGDLIRFDLPLAPQGTDFQKQAWRALCKIPYGETISYGEQAKRIGIPNAFRAVGTANGQNPISIIVPCHRVIGANGSLMGYGGGLPRKRWLLAHEAAHARARSGAELPLN